ncbi:hypothetical protein G3N55_09285 [Dissulfurirhabdus thermomarina]|uniref:Uncharacterized protein n=1 Tax=Dissulfurirhabdus thermomarina TaxID=1765737 RepID=A0A6N9TSG4_DISTH|nr:Gldg family protein [Dissulfurirhabdus thermomarina]NDY43033.1 hypothetical protein [Dissulfurirhabdus thermomarina]NMX22725.1 hypothetical protein [Dissulfurirhabdus thermomarina]
MLRDVLTLVRRELGAYFNVPIAYVYSVVFLLVAGGLFMTPFFLSGACSMRGFFGLLPLLLVVFIPALTMRLWAEERKTGSIALLLGLPVPEAVLVAGKFAAAWLFSACALAGTLVIPLMLAVLGDPDPGPILGGYLGALLLSAFLISLGMAVSAFFSDQIVAFILALLAGFGSYLAGVDAIAAFADGWIPGLGTFLKDAAGLSSHFNSFAKGVVDLADCFYFCAFTLVFLAVNVLTLAGRLRRRAARGFGAGVALLVGIGLVAGGVAKGMSLPRFDLTEEGLYTVTPATRRLLARLEAPVRVTYYVSAREKLPTPMKDIARDVGDLLEEFAALSPRFRYRVVDPARAPDRLSALEKRGIVPFNTQTIARDALDIKTIYSAIEVAYLDRPPEVIPQVMPDDLGSLEYELVSRIHRLLLGRKPKVVLVTPGGEKGGMAALLRRMQGGGGDYAALAELLRGQGYEVVRQEIGPGSPLPDDARLLVLVAPERLGERRRYEIARFLRRGHPVLVAAQRLRYHYGEGRSGFSVSAVPVETDVDELLAPFGVRVEDRMLFDRRSAVLQMTRPRRMGIFSALVQTPVDFPVQVRVLPDTMDRSLSMTSGVPELLYLWGTALDLDRERLERLGLKATVIFRSSPEAWTAPHHLGPLSAAEMTPPAGGKGMASRPLAVLLEGRFPDPFEGRPVPAWPGANATAAAPEPVEPAASRLLVVGCAEMFSDNLLANPGNALFAANAVDALALGGELIHVRAKSQALRLIGPVSDEAKAFWRVVVMFAVPALWVAGGIARAVRRRRRREACDGG